MWNEPTKEQLDKIPRLYQTESVPLRQKLIYMHFFIGGCDWYIVEYNGEDIFWGFAILGEDYFNAEWGYISFSELKEITVQRVFEIDCDLHWQIRPAIEVEKIRRCHRHWENGQKSP